MGLIAIAKGHSILGMILRLVFAMLAGTIVGLEREFKNKHAGLKTHALVCVGAAMCMVVSEYIGIERPELTTDAARLGANVVTGVGFLGAAIIINGHSQIRGLTTAAGVWAISCVGLAAGAGHIEAAAAGVAVILVILLLFSRVDDWIYSISSEFELYAELEEVSNVKDFLEELRNHDTRFSNLRVRKSDMGGEGIALTLSASMARSREKTWLIGHLSSLNYVVYLEDS